MKKRVLSMMICLCMLIGLLPTRVFAADSTAGTDMSEMNALEAIGIDTSVAPEGYDANDTSNPYGKDVVTLNPVSELLLISAGCQSASSLGYTNLSGNRFTLKATVYGHSDGSLDTYDDFMSDSYAVTNTVAMNTRETMLFDGSAEGITTMVQGAASYVYGGYAVTATVAGNFDGNAEGQEKQYALLSLTREDKETPSSLLLQILDAEDGNVTDLTTLDATKVLIEDFTNFGNGNDKQYSYQQQNYLQLAAGDFDGNGIDEIAVYIPDNTDPRIEVYQYQKKNAANDTSYQYPSNWTLVWSYSISKLGNKQYVPNMVSLLAGDFNEDGTEDLAITYSCYFSETSYVSGYAAVLFGGKDNMLNEYQEFPLISTDGDEIVRAAFTFGEITGVGTNTLVLGGQSAKDLKKGNIYSRYVALYQFNGSGFDIVCDQNFDLFSKSNGTYNYAVMSGHNDIFYSSPLAIANLAVISNGLTESATLYFDSLYFNYSDAGLELTAALDTTDTFQPAGVNYVSDSKDYAVPLRPYTEYGASSADIFGLGYDVLGTMQYFIPIGEELADVLHVYGITDYPLVSNPGGKQFKGVVTGSTYLVMAGKECVANTDTEEGTFTTKSFMKSTQVYVSSSFTFPNTDHDTSYLKYTGNHYYTYSDPEVLAVLASAPYFADLLDREDLSGNYAESTTSYGTTKGSGDGVTANASIFAGAYASFEQEIKVFGITIAKVEASETITAAFTYDFEKTSTLEQSIEYATSVGSDAVVLYSIPVVVYVYEAYIPNGSGGYDQQYMTVTSPHTAVTQVMELESYEKIAKDYAELPQIAGNILTHTLGDPTTYPTSSEGYKNALIYDGDFSAVGYSGTGGGATVTQSISMTTEESHSFNGSLAIEASAGVGAGGLVVGVTAGSEAGAGYVMTSTAGSTYTATMQNMPAEAEEYGYALSWKLFAYEQEYYNGKSRKRVPVVNYLVTNIEMPPSLPEDFAQDVERTTDDTVALTWSYGKTIAGFQIYRYYQFPDGTGSYELAFVPFDEGVRQKDGTWQFCYEDTDLSPYTEYYYQIQAVRAYVPNNSIMSEVLTARTKTDVGYPELRLIGLDEDGRLALYPDSTNTITVTVENAEDYPQGISYQWQKLENGNWVDVNGKTAPYYTFRSSGYSTEGTYRCRINVVYWDAERGEEYPISAYSNTFETVYSMRTAKVVTALSAGMDDDGKPYATVSLASTSANHNVAPTGTVTFEITGLNYSRSYNVELTPSGKIATAQLTTDMTSRLAEGIYDITATYNGSRVFLSLEAGSTTLLSGASGYRLAIYDKDGMETDSIVYGDAWSYKLIRYTQAEDGTLTQTVVEEYGSEQHANLPFAAGYNGAFGQFQKASLAIQVDNGEYAYCGLGNYHNSAGEVDYTNGYPWYAETPAGTYRLTLAGYTTEYSTEFSVLPRPITVGVTGDLTSAQGEVESALPVLDVIEGNLAYGDKLRAETEGHTDFVTMHVYNTGGREITLDNGTLPGSYTVTGAVNPNNTVLIEGENARGDTVVKSNDGIKYYTDGYANRGFLTYNRNYDVTFAPATYIVSGQQYSVTAEVNLVNGNRAGELKLISPQPVSQNELASGVTFSSGTSLMFLATPYEGYQVKRWIVTSGNAAPTTQTGNDLTLSCTMLAEPLHVKVEFEIETNTLTLVNHASAGGSVVMPTGFANGAVTTPGAQWTFTAVPAEGYSFSHWEFVVGGSNTRYDEPTVTVTMPESDAYLYPIFVRDSYVLTLGDHLRAGYGWDHDNDTTTPDVTRYVASGAKITGNTVVTVEATPGYEIPEGAEWTVDGEGVANTGSSYTFTMSKDTQISVETEQGKYDLSVSTGNGCVTVIYGEETTTVTSEDVTKTIEEVPGASAIALTARPDYGYVFDHWEVNGQPVSGRETVHNILNLSMDTAVEAVFADNTTHTVSGTFNPVQGTVCYQVLDPYGTQQSSGEYADGDDISVYDGDTVILNAAPRSSWMVGKWTVNDTVYDSDHSRTQKFESISGDISFAVDFVAQSYYTVNYSVVGEYDENEGGTIVSATADALPFASGKTDVGGGSELVITSEPADGWMVKEWKINGEVVTREDGTADHSDVLTMEALSADTATVDITVEFQQIVSYSVTIGTDASWTITWDNEADVRKYRDEVHEGEKLIFTASANAGYRLAELIVTGENVYDIVINDDGTQTCIVSALADDITISAVAKKLYSITCAETTNGTVSVTPDIAAAGDTVTITAEPDTGYRLDLLTAVYWDGEGEKDLPVSEGKTFTMPEADVEVLAVFGGNTVTRLQGTHRHDTAIKAADEMKNVLKVEKFDTIIVAAGYVYSDALSGSYLSALKDAPILLSYSGDRYDSLNTTNIDYIRSNLAEGGTVYILGGTGAVPELYETELADYQVIRLGGANRFGTNLRILEEAGVPDGSEILVCTATNFADCLSAAATGKPILLVWNERGSLYGDQTGFLDSLRNCTFTIIGGESAVGTVFEEILSNYGNVSRISGGNRFETSVKVARHYFPNANSAVLAYGENFPDGLCGGALAHSVKSPLILTNTRFASIAAEYTAANGMTSGLVLGGEGQIADNAVREIFHMAEDAQIILK